MRRGVTLRLTDLEGGANFSALFYNFEEKTERYNMPDTLKAQHTAFLTRGHCVLLRHGPRAVLHHRRHGGLARHGLRRDRRRHACASATA